MVENGEAFERKSKRYGTWWYGSMTHRAYLTIFQHNPAVIINNSLWFAVWFEDFPIPTRSFKFYFCFVFFFSNLNYLFFGTGKWLFYTISN